MSEDLKGTNVYAPVVPGTDEDRYPTHYSKYGKGGIKCVRTIAERDDTAISGCTAAISTPCAEDLCIAHYEVVQVGRSAAAVLALLPGGL